MTDPMPAAAYVATWFPDEVVEVDEGSIARTTVPGWEGYGEDALLARVTIDGVGRFITVSDHTTSAQHIADWDALPEVDRLTERLSPDEKRRDDAWKALRALGERVGEPHGWGSYDLMSRVAARIGCPLLLNEDVGEAVARMNQILDEAITGEEVNETA